MDVWTIVEGPVFTLIFGLALTIVAFLVLEEYRKLFLSNPKAAISVEVLMLVIARAGGPGHIAALLLAGAILSILLAVLTLLFNVSSYLGLLN